MNSLRWGLVLSLVSGAVIMSGCQMPKVISRAKFEEYQTLERLNKDQAVLISTLTTDKERLANQVAALQSQLGVTGDLLETQKRLVAELESRQAKGVAENVGEAKDIEPFISPRGVGLRMSSDLLFDAGKATLKAEGEKILKEAADMIRDKPNKLEICGFTDSDPITHSGWKSNFDLSGARALTVLDTLKKEGIAADRMHFSGYGEYSLIKIGDKEEKKKSRRAEIILLNQETFPTEAAASEKAAPRTKKPVTPK